MNSVENAEMSYAIDRENEIIQLKDSNNVLWAALRAVIEHHTELNRSAGRPIEHSKTIRICKTAIDWRG